MVKAFADLRAARSPARRWGRPIVTGDSADMHSHLELRWYIDIMDGVPCAPNSGAGPTVRGRPGVGRGDLGLPARRPGRRRRSATTASRQLPEAARPGDRASRRSPSACPAPWYAVYGNHDTLLLGTFDLDAAAARAGGRRPEVVHARGDRGGDPRRVCRRPAARCSARSMRSGIQLGTRSGLPAGDQPTRRGSCSSSATSWPSTSAPSPTPGPVGHGFTQHNLDTGETWWKADLSPQRPRVRARHLQPGRRPRRRGARRPVPVAGGRARRPPRPSSGWC